MLCVIPECRVSASKALTHHFFNNVNSAHNDKNNKTELKIAVNRLLDYKSIIEIIHFIILFFRQFSPISPHKQGGSPITMKKSIMTGKVDTIEFVESSTISPKKGKNLLGKMNLGGFSDFAEEFNKKENNSRITKNITNVIKKEKNPSQKSPKK